MHTILILLPTQMCTFSQTPPVRLNNAFKVNIMSAQLKKALIFEGALLHQTIPRLWTQISTQQQRFSGQQDRETPTFKTDLVTGKNRPRHRENKIIYSQRVSAPLLIYYLSLLGCQLFILVCNYTHHKTLWKTLSI